MKKNALPLQKKVIWHFEYLKVRLQANSVKFERKAPGYDDLRVQLLNDVISLWERS